MGGALVEQADQRDGKKIWVRKSWGRNRIFPDALYNYGEEGPFQRTRIWHSSIVYGLRLRWSTNFYKYMDSKFDPMFDVTTDSVACLTPLAAGTVLMASWTKQPSNRKIVLNDSQTNHSNVTSVTATESSNNQPNSAGKIDIAAENRLVIHNGTAPNNHPSMKRQRGKYTTPDRGYGSK